MGSKIATIVHSVTRSLKWQNTYTQQVWLAVSQIIGIQNVPPALNDSLMEWWIQKRSTLDAIRIRGLDSTFMLVSWKIWKERNDRVFARVMDKTPAQLTGAITEEALLWCAAGVRCLAALGWHGAATS
ncbi:hypothetical protein SEVIR_9G400800v4 [Setaria viridis]|uniref:Reverse transcriptase zinc-binding domain-containing protein n=1 Tax=Setaria viridis TaxID=4556 RepID=A0A4U6T335_SETVI|nr:hypothetical protein SEVIR_9G400800v2 [Setaria viridis]